MSKPSKPSKPSEFKKLDDEFNCRLSGLLEERTHGLYKKLFGVAPNLFVAGGILVRNAIRGEIPRYSDVDFWIPHSDTPLNKSISAIAEIFPTNTIFIINRPVITAVAPNVPSLIQFVVGKGRTPQKIVSDFDSEHCMAYMDSTGQCFARNDTVKTWETKIVENGPNGVNAVSRWQKLLEMGFSPGPLSHYHKGKHHIQHLDPTWKKMNYNGTQSPREFIDSMKDQFKPHVCFWTKDELKSHDFVDWGTVEPDDYSSVDDPYVEVLRAAFRVMNPYL